MQLIRDLHWQPIILLSACQCTANQPNSSFSRFLESSNSRICISCYSKCTATEQECREDEKATRVEREIKKEHVSYLGFLDINCRYKVKWLYSVRDIYSSGLKHFLPHTERFMTLLVNSKAISCLLSSPNASKYTWSGEHSIINLKIVCAWGILGALIN